ncbi:ABC transporter ATP-binding protein [Timonella sp. A28]|uniref:ABC transporter ATP-binding protein n=1 Tax=Timonella sp. A28 TaxID=3442640 RepID=UPI003EB95E94
MHEQHNATGLHISGGQLGYHGKTVCENLNFSVPAGEFTAIIGPNGCGKSTVLKTLARTLRPLSGEVSLNSENVWNIRPKKFAQHVASLPQHPISPESLTVKELVARGRHPYHSLLTRTHPDDAAVIDHALHATGVAPYAQRPLTELSGGQQQRAWIAMVLAQETDYVLLDEPTSFLDLAHQIELLHLCQDIRAQHRTVVAVLHDINQAARYASHLVVMHHGRIVRAGTPNDVLDAELVSTVFGIDCVIESDSQTGSPVVTVKNRQ